ncbi:hypothetical protein [Sphingomonas nostoxanthinifaciens]|uniref:hypothetical protein n=1 Tax=Sphingomonas nostoxanthinifaciens TaxID=2872652 RepID=UPI001CC1F501|nr:hypothetical protein [Sphingomonas nostoxanthinifaciens]UAK22990.1 hypothetical protein K8P63_11155 [Sphingomonas nostoxanthinifaciens]
MPMIARRRLLRALLGGALAWAGVADAQDVVPSRTLVPLLSGSSASHMLGPARRGSQGRPRQIGRLFVEIDLVSACDISTAHGAPLVHCSPGIPFDVSTRAGSARVAVTY